MPAKPKYVNEKFFDEESKAMWYILGISIAQYSQGKLGNSRINKWQSTSKPLIEIVKSSLDSEHAVSSVKNKHIRGKEDFFTNWLVIYNKKIYDALSGRGLDVPKTERIFPEDIEEPYLDHFVRGFFDAKVSCVNTISNVESKGGPREYHSQVLDISFNIPFLKDLYDILVEHAHVGGGKDVSESPLYLRGQNPRLVHDFLYRDWEFIQESGLYLPSKKARFEVNPPIENPPHHYTVKVKNMINQSKGLLLEGMSGAEAAKTLGYSHPFSLYRAFKKVTGQTIGQYLRENSVQLTN